MKHMFLREKKDMSYIGNMRYVGMKFIWKPFNHDTKQDETEHPHYGKIVTVIGEETIDRLRVSVDDFPEMNGREKKNQFVVCKDELYYI